MTVQFCLGGAWKPYTWLSIEGYESGAPGFKGTQCQLPST